MQIFFSYFIQSNSRACELAQIFAADSDYRDSYARLIDIVRPTIDFLCEVHGIITFFASWKLIVNIFVEMGDEKYFKINTQKVLSWLQVKVILFVLHIICISSS